MSPRRIGIAGAGLLGRLAAWALARQGHHVSVFDPSPDALPRHDGHGAAGFTAAGMLSPLAERETSSAALEALGWASITHWARIGQCLGPGLRLPCGALDATPLLHAQGSLLVAHGADLGAARRVLARLGLTQTPTDAALAHQAQALSAPVLARMEPALHSSGGPLHAWWLPGEAHIDTVRTLVALHDQAPNVQWHWGQYVVSLAPGQLHAQPSQNPEHAVASALNAHRFDWVLDLRGVGAKAACAVRGVRGELVWLHAPGLGLQRPVRLLHPRHRVYIVPRPGDVVLVGASEIECEDRSPVSLRSAVELMAAAHSVLPGLAEARILKLGVNLRPALPDHHPQVHTEAGLIRINGLYRHGWLLAPALLAQALRQAGLSCALNDPTHE